jgi:hypothetical protein
VPLALATATGDPRLGKLILAGVIAGWLGWKAIACWLFPFAACKWCLGSGRWHQPGQAKKKRRRKFRPCWWCKGTGRRLRLGRRVYNLLSTAKDNAS